MSYKWKKFLSYYKPYKFLFMADMACALVMAGITLVFPLLTRHITNNILGSNESFDLSIIIKIGILMVVLVFIEFLCNFFVTYKGHYMGVLMEHDLRNELFTHYQKLSFSFYDEEKTGRLMSRLTSDLFTLTELYHHGPENIVISIIKFVGAFIILLNINIPLTLIAFSLVPVMVVYAFHFNKKMKRAYKVNKERMGDINARIEDNLSGIRVVKSFASEDYELNKFKKENDRYVDSRRNNYKLMASYNSGMSAFVTLVTVIVIVFGSCFIAMDYILIGDLVAYLLYISNFTDPIKTMVNFTEQFQDGFTGFERFLEIINTEPDIKDKKGAKELAVTNGEISFKDVGFKYKSSPDYVLRHIDIEAKGGEYIALVGSSGVGKTTLCSLLPRFYEISEGSILIDDQDIQDVTMKSLRKAIGIVQQDVYLFAGSVMENLRYGRLNATDEEVIEAAKAANAHDFIMELPNGYYTDIGQRGVKLSGGQKQRLSIARVFLKNPPILIFDEATSALDNESEKVVQDSLEKLAKNRTTFVIAHRLSTIRSAERIIVLDEDGIAEEGNHEELLKKNGIYAHLYNMQFES